MTPQETPAALGRADLTLDEWRHVLGRRTGNPGCPCGESGPCPSVGSGPTPAEAGYILGLRGWDTP